VDGAAVVVVVGPLLVCAPGAAVVLAPGGFVLCVAGAAVVLAPGGFVLCVAGAAVVAGLGAAGGKVVVVVESLISSISLHPVRHSQRVDRPRATAGKLARMTPPEPVSAGRLLSRPELLASLPQVHVPSCLLDLEERQSGDRANAGYETMDALPDRLHARRRIALRLAGELQVSAHSRHPPGGVRQVECQQGKQEHRPKQVERVRQGRLHQTAIAQQRCRREVQNPPRVGLLFESARQKQGESQT
jgi:hypothetical protein